MTRLTADLDWKDNHTPVSKSFGDVYFSAEDGLAESRFVFLQANDLPEDWSQRQSYCIAETGFGTGLNFLATWDLWRKTRQAGASLHYVSVEAFPLAQDDLARALSTWTELSRLAKYFERVYPEPQLGFHRLHLPDNVTLTLLIGEAVDMLGELEAQVDTWFLDGFAPSCNPDMWRGEVLQEIARLSRPGARLATFTVAGAVRRGLSNVGFDIEKVPGFGRKREMCRGRFAGDGASSKSPPWYKMAGAHDGEKRAVVLGGGVAGAACAGALARRNWDVTLVERHGALAQEGSGNPSGIVMPRLSIEESNDSRFYTESYRYTLQELGTLAAQDVEFDMCGTLLLPSGAQEQRRFETMVERAILPSSLMHLVGAREATRLSGIEMGSDALFFPQSGVLGPASLCRVLTEGVQLQLDVEISSIDRRDGQWVLLDDRGAAQNAAPICILANGLEAAHMRPASWMPLRAFRGQISFIPANQNSRALKTIISQSHYVLPERGGVNAIGATYDRMPTGQRGKRQPTRRADHQKNLLGMEAMLPGFLAGADLDRVQGRAALRCSTPDHHPIIGPVADEDFYRDAYARLRHGPNLSFPTAQYHGGLYSHLALGSRGLTTALLGAELLASQLCGEPWPVERSIAETLHPGRFLVRQMRRSREDRN